MKTIRLAALSLALTASLAAAAAASQAAAASGSAGTAKPAIAGSAGSAAAKEPAAKPDGTIIVPIPSLPSVQLYASQLAVYLYQGSAPQPVTVSGSVYGPEMFAGSITLFPNGPAKTACPVYVSGINSPVKLNPNMSFSVKVMLQAMPGMAARSSGNCALAYTAFETVNGTMFNVGAGNQVSVPYTIRPPK